MLNSKRPLYRATSFRKSYNELSDNYPLAKQRFQNLWRRFGHDSELYQQYREIIRDYTEQGIIEEVKTEITDNKLKRPVYYLPHQAIRKDGRLTSKTRIVFDAGNILIKFRLNAIAFCSDIKQAFSQICFADEHKDAVRFLWSNDEPCVLKRPKLQVYRFNRVNFGVSSSPFLLAATIRHHIEKYKHEFPDTVELLDKNFYVDYLISGGNEFEEALQTSRRAKNIMEAAGMDLRKWITNDANLMEQWKKENFYVHPVHETVSLGANGTKNEMPPSRSLKEVQWDDPLPTHIEKEWKNGGNKTRWKQFVANRVNEITNLTDSHSWYHCAGKENPADFLSRGLSADCLVSNSRWWTDGEGIVRVGGRLENASVPYLRKHPTILSKGSKLSKLYFNSLHTRLFHVGPQGLLNAVRQKCWPLSGRNIARKTVHQCVKCFKSRPILSSQIMGNLPSERVNISSPFTIAGLDLCGPFLVKYKNQRKGTLNKSVHLRLHMFSTKAIHLELLSDLTSDALIATLKRFTSRRAKYFVSENIDWKFILPKSPHFGGLWEAGVKSVKHHLKRAIGNLHFTFEEFETVDSGRILEVYHGSDRKVRVVKVKTQSGEFKRAISKIAVLPIDTK
ncbi:integrase catalytic domain-containing protein [Trichonephila clavipes]|nr:integrase catalytic domain-containing protein [Trichonephila clavipes]